MSFYVRPLGPAVMRDINSAARAAAELFVRMHHHLPHPRDQGFAVMRIKRKTGAAGILVGKEHAVPMLPAIGGAINAALLLRACGATQRADEDDLRIRGIYDDAADAAGLVQTHVRPRLSGVGGLVDAVAHHINVSNRPGLACARPNNIWRGCRHG